MAQEYRRWLGLRAAVAPAFSPPCNSESLRNHANGNGFLSFDEYWSASTWARIDGNANGRIDSDEWVWWGS